MGYARLDRAAIIGTTLERGAYLWSDAYLCSDAGATNKHGHAGIEVPAHAQKGSGLDSIGAGLESDPQRPFLGRWLEGLWKGFTRLTYIQALIADNWQSVQRPFRKSN